MKKYKITKQQKCWDLAIDILSKYFKTKEVPPCTMIPNEEIERAFELITKTFNIKKKNKHKTL
jgi:hypothetical protein